MITVQNPTLGAVSRCFALLVLVFGISSLSAVDGAHPLQCSGDACACSSAADCPAGLACDPNTHACTQACSAASCNGGCCHNGFCAPGTSNNACGAGGGACAVCGGNTPICTSAIGGGVCAASGQGTKPQAGNVQKLNAKPGEPCCQITSINTASGVVSAKDNSTGQSFRFFVRDSALLSSLKEDQAIVADFKTQQVFTSAANGQGVRLGGILGGSSGNTSFGPVDGARPAGPVDGARPVGPIDGAKPLGPVDGARPVGPIDGAKPLGPVDGARPVGPIDGAKPLGPVDGAKPLGPVDGLRPAGPVDGSRPAGPVDGAKPLGPVDGARPAGPCCPITSINPVTGVVTAKNNSTGQSFQFTVKDSALLGSLKIGQAVFANFNNHQVTLDGKTFAGNITSVGR